MMGDMELVETAESRYIIEVYNVRLQYLVYHIYAKIKLRETGSESKLLSPEI